MSIRTMTSGDDYSYTLDYNGETIKMKETHKGCVLATYERNMYDDSDFIAIVWTGEKLAHVEYATTRGWTYLNSATIEATPEVLDQVRAYLASCRVQYLINLADENARKVEKGKEVKVVKGRKLPIGTVGIVTTIANNEYDKSNPIVFLTIDKKIVKTYANNLEVLNPTPEIDMVFVLNDAMEWATSRVNARN